MKFEYDGIIYETEQTAQEIYDRSAYIELPDGRHLAITRWLKSGYLPPIAAAYREITSEEMLPMPQISNAKQIDVLEEID